jgi:hypothetical protein
MRPTRDPRQRNKSTFVLLRMPAETDGIAVAPVPASLHCRLDAIKRRNAVATLQNEHGPGANCYIAPNFRGVIFVSAAGFFPSAKKHHPKASMAPNLDGPSVALVGPQRIDLVCWNLSV